MLFRGILMKIKFLYGFLLIAQSNTPAIPSLPERSGGESPEPTDQETIRRLPLQAKKRRLLNIELIDQLLKTNIIVHNKNNPEKYLENTTSTSPYFWVFNSLTPDLEFKLLVKYLPGNTDLIIIKLQLVNPVTLTELESVINCTLDNFVPSLLNILNVLVNF